MTDRLQELGSERLAVAEPAEAQLRITDGQPCLETVDALFYCGFLLLPWMWCVNVWLFWPDFRHGDDAVVLRYTRRSAACFVAASAVLAAWLLTFTIGVQCTAGGPGVVGPDTFAKLNVAGWDLEALGLVF